MKNELVVAAAAMPVTLFLVANVGGSTAAMTNNDPESVRTALGITAGAMLLASIATGNMPATIATAITLAGMFWLTRNAWMTPKLTDLAG